MNLDALKKLRRLAALALAAAAALAQQPAAPAEPPVRRLDEPAAASEAAPAAEPKSEPAKRKRPGRAERREQPPFGRQTVPAGASVAEAVALFGPLDVLGEVRRDAVAVAGQLNIGPEGRVGGDAVAVLGRVELLGAAGGAVVSVLGGASVIDGPVAGEAVVVLGGLTLGPKAVIERDVVVIGGQLTRHPDSVIRGTVTNLAVPGLGDFEWLVVWLRECALLARPLGFHEKLGWAWAIAFGFLGFYLLLALIFGRGVTVCAETFERRPAMSILSAVLTVLLSPVVLVILALTIVGGLLVPFVAAGLFFAGLFGKVVLLAWLGRRFTKFFGDGPLGGPVFAVLVGGLVVMLVYTIPFVGLTAYKLISWLGLGIVMLALVEAMQRNRRPPAAAAPAGSAPVPPPPVPAPAAPAMALAAPAAASVTEPVIPSPPPEPPPAGEPPAPAPAAAGIVAPLPAFAPRAASPAPAPAVPPRPAADETTLPRANLMLRLAALALDGVMVFATLAFIQNALPRPLQLHHGPGFSFLVLAAYGAFMWKHRGTTVGGIVCGLKVVRRDGRPLDWPTAVVRALGCFPSLIVAGLGFIWVAFDDEQQSWHDKIAGTIVVRVPKGASLV